MSAVRWMVKGFTVVAWFAIVASLPIFIPGDDAYLNYSMSNSSHTNSTSSPFSYSSNERVVAGTNYVIMPRTHEGISKWLYIIGDIADIVSNLNHSVMIEQCLYDAHVSPCWLNHSFPMSQVFDIKNVSKENPRLKIMKWEEFETQKNISDLEWVGCLTKIYHESSVHDLDNAWRETNYTGVRNRTMISETFHQCIDEADRMSREDGQDRLTWIPLPWLFLVHRLKTRGPHHG